MIILNLTQTDLAAPGNVPAGAVHVYIDSEHTMHRVEWWDGQQWVELDCFTEFDTAFVFAQEMEAKWEDGHNLQERVAQELEFLAHSDHKYHDTLERLAQQVRRI